MQAPASEMAMNTCFIAFSLAHEPHIMVVTCVSPGVWRRKLNLKAKFESGPSYLSLKSIDPGAFTGIS